MTPEIGRFLDGRMHEVTQMVMVLYDFCLGHGEDVKVWVDGRELVFGTGDAKSGSGFVRLLPHEVNVTVSFPRGHEIPDPLKRARGPRGSRKNTTIRTTADIDLYLRRMIDIAYTLESG